VDVFMENTLKGRRQMCEAFHNFV